MTAKPSAMLRYTIRRPHSESGRGYVARTKQIAHIDDIRTRQPYLEGNKAVVDLADLAGARTLLIVPMLKEGELIGAIATFRINAVDLENRLGDVETDCRDRLHAWLLQIVGALTAHT